MPDQHAHSQPYPPGHQNARSKHAIPPPNYPTDQILAHANASVMFLSILQTEGSKRGVTSWGASDSRPCCRVCWACPVPHATTPQESLFPSRHARRYAQGMGGPKKQNKCKCSPIYHNDAAFGGIHADAETDEKKKNTTRKEIREVIARGITPERKA